MIDSESPGGPLEEVSREPWYRVSILTNCQAAVVLIECNKIHRHFVQQEERISNHEEAVVEQSAASSTGTKQRAFPSF